MSTRGIKFNFVEGEVVLCFEPDPTKARVLYEAKILETAVSRDEEGKRQPAYHIHFQGWNNSWDRIVSECFVLKNSEKNGELMRQLAEVARRVHKNRTRKKKIDTILSLAFNGNPPPFESESEGSDDEGTTDTNDTENGDESNVESADESVHSSVKIEEKIKRKQNLDVEIPETLKRILDRDYFLINSENKLVKLPIESTVVMILESFVKTFMLDFWSPSFDRAAFCHTAPKIAIDRVLPVCKEFVDGLRICFDFTLPLILLYPAERQQFEKTTAAYKNKSPGRSKAHPPGEGLLIQSPRLRSAVRRSISVEEPSPKLPKLSPKVLCESEDSEITFLAQPEVPTRRVTRQTPHENTSNKKGDKSQTDSVSNSSNSSSQDRRCSERKQSTSQGTKKRRASDRQAESSTPLSSSRKKDARKSRKSSGGSTESCQSKTDTVKSDPERTMAQKGERPPPLLIPCNILSTRQNGTDTAGGEGQGAAPGSTDSLGESGKEDVLESVLAWHMLPPEEQDKLPTPLSLLYGGHHLLRLFVKLPELLSRMTIDDNKLGVLLKLLNQFLRYMSEHQMKLFPDVAYIPAREV